MTDDEVGERKRIPNKKQEHNALISEQQRPEGPCGRRLVLVPHREDDPG